MQAKRKIEARLSLRRAVNGHAGAQQNGQHTEAESRQQVAQDLHAELHLVGVQDHGRHHYIDQQPAEGLFALTAQDAGFGGRCTGKDQ